MCACLPPAMPAPGRRGLRTGLLVVDAADGPDDFGDVRTRIAPAPRRAAGIAETVAGAQQHDLVFDPELERALQDQADLLAHAGREQVIAGGSARRDTGPAEIQAAAGGRGVHLFVDALVEQVDAAMRAGARHAASRLATALPGPAQQRIHRDAELA